MPYDKDLYQRITDLLDTTTDVEPKKMFGGICFMHKGNMLCGIDGRRLMVRVGPEQYEHALSLKHAVVMDITGKPMKGFIFVSEAGHATNKSLSKWLDLGLNFTATLPAKKPQMKKSKKGEKHE